MNKIRILHIAVHLGGGAGKAIAGMILSGNDDVYSEIVLLEEPKNYFYYDQLKEKRIHITITSDTDIIKSHIDKSDIVVFDWWGHPLMIKVFLNLPVVKCRAIVWNHVNGCAYPYIWADFLNQFDKILFTSSYSLDNPYWTAVDKKAISDKATLVYGMGNFEPGRVMPKADYNMADQFTIGYVGTINYAKMNPRILDFYERALCEVSNARIVMIGEPSEEFLREIQERGISEYFSFPGYVENVFEYYREMDVFAYFLGEDSYATTENSLIEAMAIGIPIIVLNNPVENHIIEDKVNGLVINTIEDFVNALRWLQTDNNAKELGISERRYCILNYSAEVNGKKFYDVCSKLAREEAKEHLFSNAFGRDACDAFEHQAFRDKEIFNRLYKSEPVSEDEYRMLPHIYKEQNKASVAQFAKYFPDDAKLIFLERKIREYEKSKTQYVLVSY